MTYLFVYSWTGIIVGSFLVFPLSNTGQAKTLSISVSRPPDSE